MFWSIDSRSGSESDPVMALFRIEGEMSRLLEEYADTSSEYPPVNLWGNENEAVVTAELAGVNPDSIKVTVAEGLLTLEGERKPEETAKPETLRFRERGYGKFLRTIRLPFDVEADRITARYEKGVLRVVLPRREATKPRRIDIQPE
jgi:HSP20 family protein